MENNAKIKDSIVSILKNQKIIIYGVGYVAMKFYKALVIKGLDENILCFVVTEKNNEQRNVNGIPVKAIAEIGKDEKNIICLAVHEVLKTEVEDTLRKFGLNNYIWIYPYLFELVLGLPLKRNIEVPLTQILRECDDYRIAIRYLAIENYFGKNSFGYKVYEKAQAAYCGVRTAKRRREKFCELIYNWEINGYDSEKVIIIDDNYKILDGTHRVAAARYFGNNIIRCDIFKNSSIFDEWTGETAIMSKESILNLELTVEEIVAIENIHQTIRKNYA